MVIKEIKKACFVGAGTLGCFNSLVTAIAGYEVCLYDISEAALENSEERQRAWGEVLVENEFTTPEAIEKGLSRIRRTTDAAKAAANADLLSESVFEQLELKRTTHSKFEKLLPSHAIMTTNTSTILLSEIESAVEKGERFAAMHFHQPGKLVDLVAGPRTTSETIDILKRFVRSQNQVEVVLKKEKGGYIHNTLFGAMLSTAMTLHFTGAGTHQEIDQALMLAFKEMGSGASKDVSSDDSPPEKAGYGPFGMMDNVGFNVVYDALIVGINKGEKEGSLHPEKRKIMEGIAAGIKEYMDRGEMGVKSGKGFYAYPDPEYHTKEFLEGVTENKNLSTPIINAIIKQSILLILDGICDVEDVDLSWMHTHSPAMGPFGIMDDRGVDVILSQLKEQADFIKAVFGEEDLDLDDLKRATDFLEEMVEKGDIGKKSKKGFYTYPDPAYAAEDFLL